MFWFVVLLSIHPHGYMVMVMVMVYTRIASAPAACVPCPSSHLFYNSPSWAQSVRPACTVLTKQILSGMRNKGRCITCISRKTRISVSTRHSGGRNNASLCLRVRPIIRIRRPRWRGLMNNAWMLACLYFPSPSCYLPEPPRHDPAVLRLARIFRDAGGMASIYFLVLSPQRPHLVKSYFDIW